MRKQVQQRGAGGLARRRQPRDGEARTGPHASHVEPGNGVRTAGLAPGEKRPIFRRVVCVRQKILEFDI